MGCLKLTYNHYAKSPFVGVWTNPESKSILGVGWYDFGARNYDPALGMWFNVDPMAEAEISNTPYNYCANNPVNFTDPDGMKKVAHNHGRGTGVMAAAYFAEMNWTHSGLSDYNPMGYMGTTKEEYLAEEAAKDELYESSGLTDKLSKELYLALIDEGQIRNIDPSLAYNNFGYGDGWSVLRIDDNIILQSGDIITAAIPAYGPDAIGKSAQSTGEAAGAGGSWGDESFFGDAGFGKKALDWILAGGPVIDGPYYGGMAPTPAKLGSGLKGASTGLKMLYKNGIKGNSIVNMRSTLLNNGFTQSLTRNKSGYLFTNTLGEQVRVMSRNGAWDMRIMNQFGNYLDDIGRVALPGSTHNIFIGIW